MIRYGESSFHEDTATFPAHLRPQVPRVRRWLDLVPQEGHVRNNIRVTKAEALPVKKPKKPKVKSSSPIQKKPPLPREPIQNPAKSVPQTNTAGQQPQDQQMKNPPKHWSLMKRVVGLIALRRRKGP